jgi:hypothetical protein
MSLRKHKKTKRRFLMLKMCSLILSNKRNTISTLRSRTLRNLAFTALYMAVRSENSCVEITRDKETDEENFRKKRRHSLGTSIASGTLTSLKNTKKFGLPSQADDSDSEVEVLDNPEEAGGSSSKATPSLKIAKKKKKKKKGTAEDAEDVDETDGKKGGKKGGNRTKAGGDDEAKIMKSLLKKMQEDEKPKPTAMSLFRDITEVRGQLEGLEEGPMKKTFSRTLNNLLKKLEEMNDKEEDDEKEDDEKEEDDFNEDEEDYK